MKVCCLNGVNCASKINLGKNIQSNYSIIPMKCDSVSFKSNYKVEPLDIDWETAKTVADSLSTSTSGHRAKYNTKLFNEDVVKMLTLGVADYAKQEAKKKSPSAIPSVLIGGDARKASRDSLPIINETLLKQGVDVYYIDKPIPTPVLAHNAKMLDADVAILMTASHNPWEDGGYNLVTSNAAIAPAQVTKQVADFALKHAKAGYYKELKSPVMSKACSFHIDPYNTYVNLLDSLEIFDWQGIKDSGLTIYYDGLKGAGCNVMPKLLKEKGIPCVNVVSGGQIGPNPTKENLAKLSKTLQNSKKDLKIGLANDGDADRFGVVDENGNFVSTNDVLLLAAYHLIKNRGVQGTILRSHATSSQLDEIAQKFGRDVVDTPVGFKYIGEKILDLREDKKDIILAGEESGGFTINSHIPEKDGILATLIIADLVAQEEKPLSQILSDVKSELFNSYEFKSINVQLSDNAKKDEIIAKAKDIYNEAQNGNVKFGSFEIDAQKTYQHQKDMEKFKSNGDGIKLYFTDGSSILIRKSGTEPMIRYYLEAIDDTPDAAKEKINNMFSLVEKVFA